MRPQEIAAAWTIKRGVAGSSSRTIS